MCAPRSRRRRGAGSRGRGDIGEGSGARRADAVRPRPARPVAGRIPPMSDPDRRDASLDLTEEDFRALLAGVTAMAEQEVAAARSGPVFERPPSAAQADRMVDADRSLPADGESVEDLLAACAAVLAGGRRTTPSFFGYV